MSLIKSPPELIVSLSKKAQAKRLSLNMSQKTLSARSGVSYGVIKKFEQTGQISLGSLLKLAYVLEATDEFETLFQPKLNLTSLDELLKEEKKRKRGRL